MEVEDQRQDPEPELGACNNRQEQDGEDMVKQDQLAQQPLPQREEEGVKADNSEAESKISTTPAMPPWPTQRSPGSPPWPTQRGLRPPPGTNRM